MLYKPFNYKEAAPLCEPECTDETNSLSLVRLLTMLILQSPVGSSSHLSRVDKIEFCCLVDKRKIS